MFYESIPQRIAGISETYDGRTSSQDCILSQKAKAKIILQNIIKLNIIKYYYLPGLY